MNLKFSLWPKWCHFIAVWLTELHSLSHDKMAHFTWVYQFVILDLCRGLSPSTNIYLLDQISQLNMLIKHAESSSGWFPDTKRFASRSKKAALILLTALRALFLLRQLLSFKNRKFSEKKEKKRQFLEVLTLSNEIFFTMNKSHIIVQHGNECWPFGNVRAKSFHPS